MNLDKQSPEYVEGLFRDFNKYPKVTEEQMVRLGLSDDFTNWTDLSTMKQLTCVNHPWSRYLTKNPWVRSIFFAQGPHGIDALFDDECDCPFADLRFVIEKEENNAKM